MIFVLAALLVLPYIIPVNLPEWTMNQLPFPNSQWVELEGVYYHIRWDSCENCTENILLIHGFAGSTYTWEKVSDSLVRNGFNVLRVDLPPYGYSQKDRVGNQSQTARADKLWRLLEKLKPNQHWHLGGHSMGGGVAAAMAARYPEKTTSLVFADGAMMALPDKQRWWAGIAVNGYTQRWAEIIARYGMVKPQKIEELLKSAYGQLPEQNDVNAYYLPLHFKETASSIIEMLKSHETFQTDASRINMPTLIIWGERDSWVDISNGKNFHKKVPHARFEIVANAGHCPMETHPADFFAALKSFLNDNGHE
jgi:2-hydroxy-6-oxonona-2,4-dienedioate hydrolase